MLAVNFHLMGGMPLHALQPVVSDVPQADAVVPVVVSGPQVEVAIAPVTATRAAPAHGPDAPAEVVLRRPIALQMLLTKVRENLV